MDDRSPASRARTGSEIPRQGGTPADFEVGLVSLNQWQIAWRRFKSHKLAVFGSLLFLTIVAAASRRPLLLSRTTSTTCRRPSQTAPGDPERSRQRLPARAPSTRSGPPAACGAMGFVVRGQWRTTLAHHRRRRCIGGHDHRHDRRRRGRLLRRLDRQPADAHRRRHAEPAAPVRHPRGVEVPGRRHLVGIIFVFALHWAGRVWRVSSEVCS